MEAGKEWLLNNNYRTFLCLPILLIAADTTKSLSVATWEWLPKSLQGQHLQNYEILLQESQIVSKANWIGPNDFKEEDMLNITIKFYSATT